MRSLSGIVLATTLVLEGCASGSGNGNSAQLAPPVDEPPQQVFENFDYLGPLGGIESDLAIGMEDAPLPLVSCYGPIDDPYASCIDSVTFDGLPAHVEDLRPGQIVEIHGSRLIPGLSPPGDSWGDVNVDVKRAIVGPIERIDAERAWLTVLGQRVYAYDAAVESAAVGDTVSVYGHITGDGQVTAELVEPYAGDPLFLLRGTLAGLASGRLAIGDLEIDISSATLENFPAGASLPGDTVLVFSDQPPDQGLLTAKTLRCIGECVSDWVGGGALGWARGFLTGWRSPTDFDIDGISIRPRSCECGYGMPPPLGSFVDVFLRDGNADITRAPSTTHRLGLAGRITAIEVAHREIEVLGYRVQLSPATQITATRQYYFNVDALAFEELRVNDSIEISGEAIGSTIVAGTAIRQGDAHVVRSYDYGLEAPAIEIAGQTILTDAATQLSLCEDTGSISLDAFFATPWSDLAAVLIIAVDPDTTTLVARQVTVCTPEFR
ncbi:MAG TPA: DUF5666 domain-containing protein [Gammaproteobacteria bacterium]|nr:DUF5666 domain-containing protein [Gammaproteobacteria bacterium]